jgi:phosphoribosylformylglycinamidine synthase
MAFSDGNLELFQLGNTDDNFSGSEWAYINGKQIGDRSPEADLATASRLFSLLLEGQKYFQAAHDISNGGLAATISEMVLKSNLGATIELPAEYIPGGVTAALFSETPGRVVIAVKKSDVGALSELAKRFDIPLHRIGATGGDSLLINGASITIDELREAHTGVFEALFG